MQWTVTLHALLRCFLQIIWRSNEPQVSIARCLRTLPRRDLSRQRKTGKPTPLQGFIYARTETSAFIFGKVNCERLPCTSMRYRHIKCKNPRRSMCKVTSWMKGGEIGLPTCVHCHVANSTTHVVNTTQDDPVQAVRC